MKTLTAAMTAHINRDVTTLTTLFRVTRTDGVVIRVTAHDRDIVFGGFTYDALSGVNRTAIAASGDMKVDNLDVVGVIGLGTEVTDEDLRNGKFDFATVEIMSVNWTDPDRYGSITHRKGVLGEIKLTDNGYTAELRGLTQVLARRRGNLYQPRCRVNVFSPLKDPVTGQNGCGLNANSFKESSLVLTVASRRQFVLPALLTRKFNPSAIGVEQRGVIVDANGIARLLTSIEDGTPARSIGVSTTTELNNIRNDPYASYHLENDIDMGAFGQWTPIPNFHGILDGRGFQIRNLTSTTIAGPVSTGLIGRCMGIVRRLGIVNGTFDPNGSSTEWVGAIAGRLLSNSTLKSESGQGIIEDCYVLGISVDPNGGQGGGIVGVVGAGAIVRNCICATQIIGAIGTNVGGVVGQAQAASVLENIYWNSDFAGTTDPGNILGSSTEVVNLTDAQWVVQANFPQLDLFDDWIMAITGTVTATSTTFLDTNPDIIAVSGSPDLRIHFRPGDHVVVTGSSSNNGTYVIRQVTTTTLTLKSTETLVAEGPSGGITLAQLGAPRTRDPGRF